MSGFGEMMVWGETTGKAFDTSALQSYISLMQSDQSDRIEKQGADEVAKSFLFGIYQDTLDSSDDHGPMYARARKRLGVLEPHEIYGFVPALPAGGTWHADHLQRVSGPEHLALVAELAPPRVLTFAELGQAAFGAGADAIAEVAIRDAGKG